MSSHSDTSFIRNSTKRKYSNNHKLTREEGSLKRLPDGTTGVVTIVYKTPDLYIDATDMSDDDNVCMTLAELRISLRSTNQRIPTMYHPPPLQRLSKSDFDLQQQVGRWGVNDIGK